MHPVNPTASPANSSQAKAETRRPVRKPTASEPLLLRVADVAIMLNVSDNYVYDHWRELGGIRLGGSARKTGHLRFRRELIEAYILRKQRAG